MELKGRGPILRVLSPSLGGDQNKGGWIIMKDQNTLGGIYGLAIIGAAVYFIQHSTTLWEGLLGVIKALVWPAILIYKLLEFLKM